MRIALRKPNAEWFKAESAAAAAAIVSLAAIYFDLPPAAQVSAVTLLTYAAGFVTVKD